MSLLYFLAQNDEMVRVTTQSLWIYITVHVYYIQNKQNTKHDCMLLIKIEK